MKRTVFFISDGTGITASSLGQSLLTQFENIQFESLTYSYINSAEKLREVINEINHVAARDAVPPLIFTTLINSELAQALTHAQGVVLNFFQTFITPLEKALGQQSSHSIGRTHGIQNSERYKTRINAINFTLSADDGANQSHYQHADVILLGVSRSGKTPTCLYLALQFGTFAANYPITEDDFPLTTLPQSLQAVRKKIFGLTIDPAHLQAIRQERKPGGRYASLEQCQLEVNAVETLYRRENIPFLSTTTRSIEEIATLILNRQGISRLSF